MTEEAKAELKRILGERLPDPGSLLRLVTPPMWQGEGDFGIAVSPQGHGDLVVDFNGERVLLVDPALADQLAKAVLDFKDSPGGARFTLDVY